jgi:hypothetical protein
MSATNRLSYGAALTVQFLFLAVLSRVSSGEGFDSAGIYVGLTGKKCIYDFYNNYD